MSVVMLKPERRFGLVRLLTGAFKELLFFKNDWGSAFAIKTDIDKICFSRYNNIENVSPAVRFQSVCFGRRAARGAKSSGTFRAVLKYRF